MIRHVLEAPAKLTLTLAVTGVRDHDPFRGYHLIDAVMTTLDLCDVLDIEETDPDSPSVVSYVGPFADGLNDLSGDDLVSRALHAIGRAARVTITKNIPHGGGLGGGSADAAAILRWAGVDDLDLAARLGADVAFCLAGRGRARVRGIGEVIEPLEDRPGIVTLVVPPFSVSTPAVYREWDAQVGASRPSTATSHVDDDSIVNGLEAAAVAVEPRLALWKQMIVDATGVTPILAGSGATWFVPGDLGHLATNDSSRLPGATVIVAGHA